jgi:hypothetical protein
MLRCAQQYNSRPAIKKKNQKLWNFVAHRILALMKVFALLFILIICSSMFAQDIDRNDPTYMKVDNEYNAHLIDWKGAEKLGKELLSDSWIYLGFEPGEIPDSASVFPIRFNTKRIRPKLGNQLKKHALFYLDTANMTDHRSYHFYSNPVYFDSLYFVDALYLENNNQKVGIVTEELLNKVKPIDLCSTLIRLGVINTYYHLNSELTVVETTETASYFEVHYFVQWHICTNSCDDPIYEFGLKLDKQTGELFAFYYL